MDRIPSSGVRISSKKGMWRQGNKMFSSHDNVAAIQDLYMSAHYARPFFPICLGHFISKRWRAIKKGFPKYLGELSRSQHQTEIVNKIASVKPTIIALKL